MLTNMIGAKESEQVLRVKIFNLPCSVEHRTESYTLLKHFSCEMNSKAPSYITLKDFALFLVPYTNDAITLIEELDKPYQLNPECLENTLWMTL